MHKSPDDFPLPAADGSEQEISTTDSDFVHQHLLAIGAAWRDSFPAADTLAAFARILSARPRITDQTDGAAAFAEHGHPSGGAGPQKPKGSLTLQTPQATPNTGMWPAHPVRLPRLTTFAAALITAILLTGAIWGFQSFQSQHGTPPKETRQFSVHHGTLHCRSAPYSFGNLNDDFPDTQPPVDWLADGTIITSSPRRIFAANSCIAQGSGPYPAAVMAAAVWSPDGTRILLVQGALAQVDVATTGQELVSLLPSDPAFSFQSGVWADGGRQIVAVLYSTITMTDSTASIEVQIWNSQTGAPIRTAFSLNSVTGYWLSPDGTYVAVQSSGQPLEFWNVTTGQQVSRASSTAPVNAESSAWSPNGAFLALGIGSSNSPQVPAQVQVWSSATGQLVATLTDPDTFQGLIGGLAWSPNGQYLAESSGRINIFAAATWQKVAAFGAVSISTPAGNGLTRITQIISVTWSPDNSMVASVTHSFEGDPNNPTLHVANVLSVWQLS
jgi:WD40 repeat protein